MVWKASNVKQIFQSVLFREEHAVKEVWRPGEKISYKGIENVDFMQERSELKRTGHAILEGFADLIHFPEMSPESSRFFLNYERISVHVFMA